MNSLSWFLYFVEVVANIKYTTVFVFVASLIYVAIATLVTAMHNDFHDCKIESGRKVAMKYPDRTKWPVFIIGTMLLSSVIPSSGTMYAIAASEAGERIAKSEAVQGMASDAQKALHQWIKRQIEPETKK